jgi:hypothetical protein
VAKVYFSPDFDAAAMSLGSIAKIDAVLAPFIDALQRNPYAFRLIENEWVRCRYGVTKPVGDVPALLVTFTIDDDGDVIMRYVEEHLSY